MALTQILLLPIICVVAQIGGNELIQPEVRASSNGILKTVLKVDAFHYTKDTPVQFWTRVYEQNTPGPTLRIKPGDVVNITLVNNLLPDIDGPLNTFHNANTTNLHTHGLHVSPSGLADDIFRMVKPGESADYSYNIPSTHPFGGVFWYHPHSHGSSTLQQSGGLAGAIIVDPVDPTAVPPEIRAMKEVVLVLQHLCFDSTSNDLNPYDNHIVVSQYGLDNLTVQPSFIFPNMFQSYFTVNGQYQPVIRLQPGEFQLFRVINAGHAAALILQIPGCEMWTITLDGNYVKQPYTDPEPLLVSATHMDIAVRCPAIGNYSVGSWPNASYQGDFESNTKIWEGVLATLVVSGDILKMDLPATLPDLPPYMKDLTMLNDSDINATFFVMLHAEGGPVTPGDFPNTYYINGVAYSGDPNQTQYTMKVGEIQQWTINAQAGGVNHPYHSHTNPFQIIRIGNDPTFSMLGLRPGTWRDTIPTMDGIPIYIRFMPDTWTGIMVIHCHMTPHIDLGMMATIETVANSSTS